MSRFTVPADRVVVDDDEHNQYWQSHHSAHSMDTCSSATLHDSASPVADMYYENDNQKLYTHAAANAMANTPRSSDPLTYHAQQRKMDDIERNGERCNYAHQHRRYSSYPGSGFAQDIPFSQQCNHQLCETHNGHRMATTTEKDHMDTATAAVESNLSWQNRLCRFRADWRARAANGGALTQLLHVCLGEFLGNFLITLPVALTIAESFMIDGGNLDSGKFSNIALSLGVSVALSVLCFARITGTSLHSSVTLCMALFGRIAWWRVPFQLASQIFGAFVAELVANGVYWTVMKVVKQSILTTTSEENPVSVLGFTTIFSTLKQMNRSGGQLFLSEFVSAFLASIAIASLFDLVNPLSSLTIAGPVMGAFYAMHTLAFVPASTMGNPAQDLGSRMACAALLGKTESCFAANLTANSFFTPTLGMLIGFSIFFFFLSSGPEEAKKRKTPADVLPQRQIKRALLRPFQYKARGGEAGTSSAAHPHRRVVSFGHKFDDTQSFKHFVRLEEGEVASVVSREQQQQHSTADAELSSRRGLTARQSWQRGTIVDEPHALQPTDAGQKAPNNPFYVPSSDWLIRNECNVTPEGKEHRGRKPVPSHSVGPSSADAVAMSALTNASSQQHKEHSVKAQAR